MYRNILMFSYCVLHSWTWYNFFMNSLETELKLIKDLGLDVLAGKELTQEDIDFLFSCLKPSFSSDVHIAALLLLTESDDDVLDQVMERYSGLPVSVQHLLISYLTTTDYIQCFVFLFNIIKTASSEEEVNVAIFSLAQTHYFILPLIFTELNSDDALYVNQLKRLLFMIGIDRLKPYLAVLPQIPHEAIFRQLFGPDKIDRIKNS